jgi:pyruvate,water dikinase
MSFAGQYRSVLDVKRGDIVHAYKTVVAGKYSPQAMRYRLHHGVRDDEVAMCAGCMPMIEAEWGGVVYTRNPLDEEDDAVHIFASKGLPRNVVDGAGEVETFIVRRDENADQSLILESGTGLEAETLLDLKRLALATEAHFGAAQDIEWVIGNGDFVFLQCRPLTRRAKKRAPLDKPPDTDGEIVMKGGVTASRGVAAGPVFVATQKADARGFPKGGVLVVTQPLPFWATLFEQAAAVVAENGSIACHLANVAREYGVPALFGARGAARKLAAGAVVTVDADHQRILQGKPEALSDDLPAPRVPGPDSPMTQLTKRVADLILPLRLLDPDDAGFKPERCETLHDITRFCHEKAVQEMFRFGKDHDFPELASRRLYKDGPAQFWVVDLDDGLYAGADDPHFVRFEDIVSIPMLAIWRGMEARPWEGPPPADPKGFFQVLASSTMDAHLDASTPSRYAVGNDVMISKHYCSLQSRFGFHLASAEALVSSRTSESYIHFRFGGGGAGQARKNRRARLVAELLAENGFASEYVKDTVSAHIGGLEKSEMEKRLEIVGYVLVHTRQLDMSMTDDASVERYKRKMMDDLQRLR